MHHYNYPQGDLTANSAVTGCVWRVIITIGNAMSRDCFSNLLIPFGETAIVEYSKSVQINQLLAANEDINMWKFITFFKYLWA